MTIPTDTCRRLLIAASMVLAIGFLTYDRAAAQPGPCICPNVNVVNNAHCTLTLILQGSSEKIVTVPANGPGSFPCEVGQIINVQDCKGNLHPLRVNRCVSVVIEDGCCTDVCLQEAAEGCYTVVVKPPLFDCPCQ